MFSCIKWLTAGDDLGGLIPFDEVRKSTKPPPAASSSRPQPEDPKAAAAAAAQARAAANAAPTWTVLQGVCSINAELNMLKDASMAGDMPQVGICQFAASCHRR